MRAAAIALLATCCTAAHAAPPAPGEPVVYPQTGAAPVESRKTRGEPVVYMVMTDRFADGDLGNDLGVDRTKPGYYHGGDFRGLREHMGYLADLGVDVLWVTPIVDNIDAPRISKDGFVHYGFHGYWAKDFEHTDEHLGSPAELRAMVDAAHARGIAVFLDVVLNHAGYGSPWEARADWTRSTTRGDCGQDDLTSCLWGLPDFRTEKPEVRDYLVRTQLGWARQSGCDGFRVDAVKHAPHELWHALRGAVDALRPGFRLLGEVWGASASTDRGDAWLAKGEMDWLFDFEFGEQAFGFVTGAVPADALDRYLAGRAARADRYVHYLDTHDLPGFLSRVHGDRSAMKLAATLELTVPGIPLIYYGDEVARPTGEWPENRTDMPWGAAQDADMLAHYRRLIAARKRLAGPIERVVAEAGRYVFRRGEGLVVLNASKDPFTAPLAAPTPTGTRYVDALSGTPCQGGCTVPARTAAVFFAEPRKTIEKPARPTARAVRHSEHGAR
jgi:alpha-amylase